MSEIILIETSTSLLSVGLCEDGRLADYRECAVPRSQASMTVPLIEEMLSSHGLRVGDCDAVCVSSGPGSYTGLRVGSSTAKGLCFGAGLPLIAVPTLDILVAQALEAGLPEGCRYIIPMIDARRMEVYSAVYSAEGRRLGEVRPVIVDGNSFSDERAAGCCVLIGDGAAKCEGVLSGDVRIVSTCPKASAMASLAQAAYDEKRFENTAYFEPFYLKEFVATKSSKQLF